MPDSLFLGVLIDQISFSSFFSNIFRDSFTLEKVFPPQLSILLIYSTSLFAHFYPYYTENPDALMQSKAPDQQRKTIILHQGSEKNPRALYQQTVRYDQNITPFPSKKRLLKGLIFSELLKKVEYLEKIRPSVEKVSLFLQRFACSMLSSHSSKFAILFQQNDYDLFTIRHLYYEVVENLFSYFKQLINQITFLWREYALDFAEKSNQQTNWHRIVAQITSGGGVGVFFYCHCSTLVEQ